MKPKIDLPVNGYIYVGDSDSKQRYKEAQSASIASCSGDFTSATLAGRRGIGTGDIGRDGKVLSQCQVCALREGTQS